MNIFQKGNTILRDLKSFRPLKVLSEVTLADQYNDWETSHLTWTAQQIVNGLETP